MRRLDRANASASRAFSRRGEVAGIIRNVYPLAVLVDLQNEGRQLGIRGANRREPLDQLRRAFRGEAYARNHVPAGLVLVKHRLDNSAGLIAHGSRGGSSRSASDDERSASPEERTQLQVTQLVDQYHAPCEVDRDVSTVLAFAATGKRLALKPPSVRTTQGA